MISNFLLFFGQLNLVFLSFEKKKKVVKKCDFLKTKAIKIFKYRKNNNKY